VFPFRFVVIKIEGNGVFVVFAESGTGTFLILIYEVAEGEVVWW
jgi:hypothetical protein